MPAAARLTDSSGRAIRRPISPATAIPRTVASAPTATSVVRSVANVLWTSSSEKTSTYRSPSGSGVPMARNNESSARNR